MFACRCRGLVLNASNVLAFFLAKGVVIVTLVASDFFDDMQEGRDFHGLSLYDALGLENDEPFELVLVGIDLEILAFPYKAVALLADGVRARVLGHHDHGVFEIHHAPLRISPAPIIQNLEQNIKDILMGFFYFIK